MRRSSALPLFAAAFGVSSVCIARDALALGPLDIEAGIKIGAGTSPFSGEPNALGFGLGGRAGASFAGYYGGLNLMYYFGESGTVDTVSVKESALLYGIEAGYGLKLLDLLTVRGLIGVGNFTVSYTGQGSGSPSNLYLEPNLTALLAFGLIYVGADAGVLVLPGMGDPARPLASSSWLTAFTAHGQVGIKF